MQMLFNKYVIKHNINYVTLMKCKQEVKLIGIQRICFTYIFVLPLSRFILTKQNY